MATTIRSFSRLAWIASCLVIAACGSTVSSAQDAAPLPDYVIEKFGKPPAVPTGPLSGDVQSAVKAAFVDGMTQPVWGKDQELALRQISDSKDPRLAWIISDLMRFVSERELAAVLSGAASKLLGKKIPDENPWGAEQFMNRFHLRNGMGHSAGAQHLESAGNHNVAALRLQIDGRRGVQPY